MDKEDKITEGQLKQGLSQTVAVWAMCTHYNNFGKDNPR